MVLSIPPSGDITSMVLFAILVLVIFALIGFVWIKLGTRPPAIERRGLKVLVNLALPSGKVVLTDAAWRAIGETDPDHFDSHILPAGCAAALFSREDFRVLLANETKAGDRLSQQLSA
jgi:hypothetical protein